MVKYMFLRGIERKRERERERENDLKFKTE
jgi:hypothetical protein